MIDPARVERLYRLLRHRPVVATLVQACREAGGVPVHLVGGLLRDRLLGLPSRDYDAVVAGHGREVAAAVAERLGAHLVHLGGKDFAAYRVVGSGGDDWVLDIWDREDQPLDADLARRDFTVNSFALDLAAEPSEPGGGGRFVDPFGGVADLDRRCLRATTEASLTGDPLRVLRLPRLLVQLPGFAAEPGTLQLARAAAPGLATVAAERVREELVLLFRRSGAHRAFALLVALDVYPSLWRGEPGVAATPAGERRAGRATLEMERVEARVRDLEALAGAAGLGTGATRAAVAEAAAPRAAAARAAAAEAATTGAAPTGAATSGAAARGAVASGPVGAGEAAAPDGTASTSPFPLVDLLATRYALTFRHLPREEGTPDQRTAAALSALERFRDAGYATRSLADRTRRLVEALGAAPVGDAADDGEPEGRGRSEDHGRPEKGGRLDVLRTGERAGGGPGATASVGHRGTGLGGLPAGENGRRRFLHRLGELWPAAAVLAGVRHDEGPALEDWRSAVRDLGRLLAQDGERILSPPRLLGGQEVQSLLGLPPGPGIGEALAAIEAAQVDGEIRTREEAVALLRRLR